jgi:hypothetical protein
MEITNDEVVDTFEDIRNSMIKKEEIENKKQKYKRSDSNKRRSRSSSSSEQSYVKRKSSKHEYVLTNEMKRNFDLNYFKLQYENYLKNAAAYLSQNMGNMNNLQNLASVPPNISNGLNPLLNHFYPNHFANNNHLHNKPDKNSSQNSYANANLMPHMFPILNPYIPMFSINPNFTQSYVQPVSEKIDQKKKESGEIKTDKNISKIIL